MNTFSEMLCKRYLLEKPIVVGRMDCHNLLSIDVEEWFHGEFVRDIVQQESQSKVVEGVCETIKVLDKYRATCTFFLVGELLERNPELGEIIIESGNEIGFHGYDHHPLWDLTPRQFNEQLSRFRGLMSKYNYTVRGYRAPSASLDKSTYWAIEILRKNGYVYDSSIFPAITPLYGVPLAESYPYTIDSEFIEYPFLTLGVKPFRIPMGTGFWFRVIPMKLFDLTIRHRNKMNIPAMISLHTWEFVAKVPLGNLGLLNHVWLRCNLTSVKDRLRYLLRRYRFQSIAQYHDGTV